MKKEIKATRFGFFQHPYLAVNLRRIDYVLLRKSFATSTRAKLGLKPIIFHSFLLSTLSGQKITDLTN
jgi:hypothetical protein